MKFMSSVAFASLLASMSFFAHAQQDLSSSFFRGFQDGCKHPTEFVKMTQSLCTWSVGKKGALPECTINAFQTPIQSLISPVYNLKKDPAKTPDLLSSRTQGALRIDTFAEHQTFSFQLEPKKAYFGPLAVSKVSLLLGRGNGINISLLEFSDALTVKQAQAVLAKSNIMLKTDNSGAEPVTPELWFDKDQKKLLLMCDSST